MKKELKKELEALSYALMLVFYMVGIGTLADLMPNEILGILIIIAGLFNLCYALLKITMIRGE